MRAFDVNRDVVTARPPRVNAGRRSGTPFRGVRLVPGGEHPGEGSIEDMGNLRASRALDAALSGTRWPCPWRRQRRTADTGVRVRRTTRPYRAAARWPGVLLCLAGCLAAAAGTRGRRGWCGGRWRGRTRAIRRREGRSRSCARSNSGTARPLSGSLRIWPVPQRDVLAWTSSADFGPIAWPPRARRGRQRPGFPGRAALPEGTAGAGDGRAWLSHGQRRHFHWRAPGRGPGSPQPVRPGRQ